MNKKSTGSLVAERTLQVLLLFQENKKMTLAEITKALDVSHTATHRIVTTLKDMGFLLRDETKRYMLSTVFLKFARMVEPNLRTISLPVMKELSSETQESIYLSVSHNPSYYVFIEGVESPHPLKWSVDFGEPASTLAGAAGKSHLSFYSEKEWIETIEENGLTAYTENTIINKGSLINEMKKIKQEGFSISKSERYEGVIGISVQVNEFSKLTNSIVLSIFIPEYRYNAETLSHYVTSLKYAAKSISARL